MSNCASPRVDVTGEIPDHAIDALIDWLIGRRLDDPEQVAAVGDDEREVSR